MEVQSDLDGQRLPAEIETALYRIVQESLTNVAQARRCEPGHRVAKEAER